MKLAALKELIRQRYGWQLESHGAEALERAIRQRMLWAEASSEERYLTLLEPDNSEFQALLEDIVVPESWFFREREAITHTVNWVMEQHARSPQRGFRILSAPCSRGEEPVSLSIALLEAGLPQECLSIDAVDLSAVALEQARRGIYTGFSFRGEELGYRERAFQALQGGWKLKESFRAPISYHSCNILELSPFLKGYDVIFCRNLLIYLTDPARAQLFKRFHAALQPQGIMFLASSEFALPPASLFTAQSRAGALVFHKQQPYVADATRALPKVKPPLLPGPNPKPPVSRSIRPHPTFSKGLPILDRGLAPPVPPTPPGPAPNDRADAILRSLLEAAELSANAGRLDEARVLCHQVLQQGPSSRAYYLLALVHSARNENEEAESNLRRALYLEPDFKEALGQLALCRERSGDIEGSRRLRERMKR